MTFHDSWARYTQSHADELVGAVDTLISHAPVDAARLFVLTSSDVVSMS